MKPMRLFTPSELDPLMATIINARFNVFFARFCAEMGLQFEPAV